MNLCLDLPCVSRTALYLACLLLLRAYCKPREPNPLCWHMRWWYNTLQPKWNNIKKLFLRNPSIWACNQLTTCALRYVFVINIQQSESGQDEEIPINTSSTAHLTFWAGYFRQVGKFLIAVVALAAAEKHLRVFFCSYALLPASHAAAKGREKTTSVNSCLGANAELPPNCLLVSPSTSTAPQALLAGNLALKYPSE